MPTFTPILPDPTDVVLQGGKMLLPVEPLKFPDVPEYLEGRWPPLIIDPPDRLPAVPFSIVQQSYAFGMVDLGSRQFSARVMDQAVNACICTPCGEIVPVLMGHQWFWNDTGQTTAQFYLTGVTRDSTGTPLGNCRVVVYESGRIYVGGNECRVGYATDSPIVGETISDGSGNYTLLVPLNTAYQAMGYLAGSPDVFGTTLNTLTPSQG